MEIKTFAPVMIPTLCRYDHFKRCVESLARCKYAECTDVYIALDYPLNDSHVAGYNKICSYVDTISGFKSVTVIRRPVNYGVIVNIRSIRAEILKKYDRIIFTEDDNEFSYDFLQYINEGLEYYICGYRHPFDNNIDKEYFLSQHFAAWGYGIWRDKAIFLNSTIFKESYPLELIRKCSLTKFCKEYIDSSLSRILGKGVLGDMYTTYYQKESGSFSVFPAVSKVRNWGHDGSGTNCDFDKNDIYSNQKIDTREVAINYDWNPTPIQEKFKFNKQSIKYRLSSVYNFILIKLYLVNN